MPLLINALELRPAMRLAQAFTWHGRMMLPGGKVLTSGDVEIVRKKYPEVSLHIADPVLDGLAEFEDDTRDREVAAAARQSVATCIAKVQEQFGGRTSMEKVDFVAARAAASSVIDYILSNPVSAALLDRGNDPANPLAGHGGNVFYLSIVLSSAVRDYVMAERKRLTSASTLSNNIATNMLPLGLGAMFADVGMFDLQHIFAPGYKLTPADRKAVLQHPARGADLLPDNLPPGTKLVVRSHHENFDGSGYPAAQPSGSMHVFTRIVRVCDAYVAGTAKRPHREAKSQARVIWEMCCGLYRTCYDPELTKVLAGLIQPFPIGSQVRLRDGRFAVVVKYNHANPFRPTALVAFGPNGERLPESQVVGPVTIGDEQLPLGSFEGEDLSFVAEVAAVAAPPPPTAPSPKVEKTFDSVMDISYP